LCHLLTVREKTFTEGKKGSLEKPIAVFHFLFRHQPIFFARNATYSFYKWLFSYNNAVFLLPL
jgi:hypothetical protein